MYQIRSLGTAENQVSRDFDDNKKAMWLTSSTDRVDSYSSIIVQQGIDIKEYKTNPIILENHDRKKPSIAKTVDFERSDRKTDLRIEFATNQQGGMYYDLYKGGYQNAWSIGGNVPFSEVVHSMSPKDMLKRLARVENGEEYLAALRENKARFVYLKLLKNETSAVTLGANPGALSRAAADGVLDFAVACSLYEDALQSMTEGLVLLQRQNLAGQIQEAKRLDADLTLEQRLAWHVLSRLRL